MNRFFSSDLHFGHTKIIGYCARPFADTDEMHEQLVERWNDTVSPHDEVWVLGDFAMGKIAETLPYGQRLNGRKILVPGNHDRCWVGRGRKDQMKWTPRYHFTGGFDVVLGNEISVRVAGHRVQISHFPYAGDHTPEDRYLQFRPSDHGLPLLHGHVHDKYKVYDHPAHPRMINVGTDVWDFAPVHEEQLEALL